MSQGNLVGCHTPMIYIELKNDICTIIYRQVLWWTSLSYSHYTLFLSLSSLFILFFVLKEERIKSYPKSCLKNDYTNIISLLSMMKHKIIWEIMSLFYDFNCDTFDDERWTQLFLLLRLYVLVALYQLMKF